MESKIFRKPIIIAGPCSAESEQQILETAEKLKSTGIDFFRAGSWKPRTRPNSFEGKGEEALRWLNRAKRQFGVKVTTEVASPQHVELALKYEIDALWIGARSTANPFTVQEISESLKGIDIPVMVKNPVNPDLNLWIGAVERIRNVGIKNLFVIHRGFYPFEKTKYRNVPKWEIPIEFKRLLPDIPIICDPSHISGNKDFIATISQKAFDLDFDGLMIEVHPNPEEALSDSDQQLKPYEFTEILNSLVVKKASDYSSEIVERIENLRDNIDSIDYQLLELLAQRMKIVREIGEYKCEHNMTILQLRRWENILSSRLEFAGELQLDNGFIKNLLQLVHKESIQTQSDVLLKLKRKGKCGRN